MKKRDVINDLIQYGDTRKRRTPALDEELRKQKKEGGEKYED